MTPRAERPSLGTLFLTVFIDLVGFSIIFPLFPAMMRYYLGQEGEGGLLGGLIRLLEQLTVASADPTFLVTVLFGGVLGSFYALLQFIASPLLGRLSDRVGRRPVLLGTIAGNAVGYAIWAVSGSFALLLLARVVNGVMSGNLSVASAAIADVTSRENRSRGMALIGVAFGLGFIVGPAVGGLSAMVDLSARYPGLRALGINPFSMPALAALVLTLVNLFWVARRLRETLPPGSTEPRPRASLLRLLTVPSRGLRLTIVINLLFTLSFSGMEFSLTFLVAERLGYGPTDNVVIFLFLGVVLILTQGLIVRRLAPRVGERPLGTAGLVLGLGAFVTMALAHSAPVLFFGLALLALGAGLVHPALSGLASLYSHESDQGQNMGIFRSAGSLARGVGPLVAAAVYFTIGSRNAYLIGGAASVLPLLLSLRLPHTDHDEVAPATRG